MFLLPRKLCLESFNDVFIKCRVTKEAVKTNNNFTFILYCDQYLQVFIFSLSETKEKQTALRLRYILF